MKPPKFWMLLRNVPPFLHQEVCVIPEEPSFQTLNLSDIDPSFSDFYKKLFGNYPPEDINYCNRLTFDVITSIVSDVRLSNLFINAFGREELKNLIECVKQAKFKFYNEIYRINLSDPSVVKNVTGKLRWNILYRYKQVLQVSYQSGNNVDFTFQDGKKVTNQIQDISGEKVVDIPFTEARFVLSLPLSPFNISCELICEYVFPFTDINVQQFRFLEKEEISKNIINFVKYQSSFHFDKLSAICIAYTYLLDRSRKK